MSSPAAPSAVPGVRAVRVGILDVLRVASLIVTLASLAVWGLLDWPFPANVAVGAGAPVAAAVVWALFVSPRAVVAVHPFVRAVVELLVFSGATIALWRLGLPWVGLGVGAACVAIGLAHHLRSLR